MDLRPAAWRALQRKTMFFTFRLPGDA